MKGCRDVYLVTCSLRAAVVASSSFTAGQTFQNHSISGRRRRVARVRAEARLRKSSEEVGRAGGRGCPWESCSTGSTPGAARAVASSEDADEAEDEEGHLTLALALALDCDPLSQEGSVPPVTPYRPVNVACIISP